MPSVVVGGGRGLYATDLAPASTIFSPSVLRPIVRLERFAKARSSAFARGGALPEVSAARFTTNFFVGSCLTAVRQATPV